jgi:hypothetical protein
MINKTIKQNNHTYYIDGKVEIKKKKRKKGRRENACDDHLMMNIIAAPIIKFLYIY